MTLPFEPQLAGSANRREGSQPTKVEFAPINGGLPGAETRVEQPCLGLSWFLYSCNLTKLVRVSDGPAGASPAP